MHFLDLMDIAERDMDLINPTSADKVLACGEAIDLRPGQRVIDFGSGMGEVLALWAERFGIRGVGIDVRAQACARAREKMIERRLDDHIEIVCDDASRYPFEPGAFDVAACIGATFIWSGFQAALHHMARAVRPDGWLVVGEIHWRTSHVPPSFARQQSIHTEYELFHQARAAGYDVASITRASQDDWDRYLSGNWQGLLRWLGENPEHPERREVSDHLRASQEEYFRYGREHHGWAIYTLRAAHHPGEATD